MFPYLAEKKKKLLKFAKFAKLGIGGAKLGTKIGISLEKISAAAPRVVLIQYF